MAVDYLAKAFSADGLAGPVTDTDTPYMQHFMMNRVTLDPATSVTIAGQTFVLGKDFYTLTKGTALRGPVQLTFAGYDINTEGYVDVAATNLKGKNVAMLLGEPPELTHQKPILPF